VGQTVEDGRGTCRVAGQHMEYATHGRFCGFEPQNPGGGSKKEWTTCGGIKKVASKQSYLMKRVVAVGCRLCRVGQKCPCG